MQLCSSSTNLLSVWSAYQHPYYTAAEHQTLLNTLKLQHIWGHHSPAPTWWSVTTIFKDNNIELRRGKLPHTKFQKTLF